MPGRRIVLIEVSQSDVEQFVNRVVADGGIVTTTDDGELFTLDATVEAVVARPKLACKCAEVTESRSQRRRRLKTSSPKMLAFSRSTKLGWWCCSTCGRPSKAAVTHWITSMLVGANDLLPKLLGSGEAISPQDRWERDGGIPNEHANGDHFTPGVVKARDGLPAVRKSRRHKATQATGI